jgi:hypothetical protein
MALKQDGLVAGLVPDPSNVPDLAILSGFLGNSSQTGHWRLYFTPDLSEWAEIPKASILHSVQLTHSQSPLGGTIVWVARTAKLQYHAAVPSHAPGDFLQGDVVAEYLQGTGGQWPRGGLGSLVACSCSQWTRGYQP